MTPDTDRPTQPGLPSLPVSFIRSVAPWKRPATATTVIPAMHSVLTGWRPDPPRLAEYRALVGSAAEVPIAFPQVPVMAMHMDLISRLSFPLRGLGMIHLGSVVDVLAPVPADAAWDLRVWSAAGRNMRVGLEFDLWGEVRAAGQPCWRSRAVYLSRSRSASGAEESAVPVFAGPGPWGSPWEAEVPLPVPEGTGRAFARVTGDANPIHLHAATARPFGFSRAIVHGWWTTGRVAAMLGVDEASPGRRLEIAFRRPIELPSTPLLRSRRTSEGVVDFAVVRDGGALVPAEPGKPLVAGRVSG